MRVRSGTGRKAREALLYQWYRDRLRERIPEMVAKSEPTIGVVEVVGRGGVGRGDCFSISDVTMNE